MILDGATAPSHIDSGCIHDVPWLVRHLAAGIVQGLALDAVPLADVLAEAIRLTCKAHEGTCDLSNPDSPSSTAAIVRAPAVTRWTISCLVTRRDPALRPRHPADPRRPDRAPAGRPPVLLRPARPAVPERTRPASWVASTRPDAAYEAISGSAEGVSDAAMLTDGVTRPRDWYGWDWRDLLDGLRYQGGPAELIRGHARPSGRRARRSGRFTTTRPRSLPVPCSSPPRALVIPDPFAMVR